MAKKRIFKTKTFSRWLNKNDLNNRYLLEAVEEMEGYHLDGRDLAVQFAQVVYGVFFLSLSYHSPPHTHWFKFGTMNRFVESVHTWIV
jgi:hypothetical protein